MKPANPYIEIAANPEFVAYQSLVSLLEDYAKKIATFQEVGSLGEFDQALREIAIPVTADLIAIKELIRLGFGSTAETLLRTQIERIATIAYLRIKPEKIKKWAKVGGDIAQLKVRIDCMDNLRNPLSGAVAMNANEYRTQLKDYVDSLQSLVHCNRAGAYNTAFEKNSDTFLVAGSNPFNPRQISRVSNYAGQVLCYLLQELNLEYQVLCKFYLGEAA